EFKISGYYQLSINKHHHKKNSHPGQQPPILYFISDIYNKDPHEVIDYYKSEYGNALDPIIIVSASPDEQREKTFFDIGIYDYLVTSEISALLLERIIHKTLIQSQSRTLRQSQF